MPSLYTEIAINAPRALIWQALIEKEAWAYWNTYLYDADPNQPLELGRSVWLSLRRIPGDAPTEFQSRILVMQPNACLRWTSSIPGFTCEQSFELQDCDHDRTQYIQRSRFSGYLTRLFLPFIRQDEQQGIRRMAWELKQYVERW